MKYIYKFILILSYCLGLSACNFLDIVPDEKESAEDALEDVVAAERFLYSCYSYLPQPRHGPSSIDLLTGDEVVVVADNKGFALFPQGNYTATNPVISDWNTVFQGIRQCYIFINGLDDVKDLSEELRIDYEAQAQFLIAYYHFLLIRAYGPTILVKEQPDILTQPKDYLGRSPYDECVDFVCDKLDKAARNLPASRSVMYYGLATSVAAKCTKAKLLLYAASPLFNGNAKFYSNFKNPDGENLMPLEYDQTKWDRAKKAMKEAIDLAEANGAELYNKTDRFNGNKEPSNPMQHKLRNTILEPGNSEILWADARNDGFYGVQNRSLPYCEKSAWNNTAPTLTMLERFYTKNGLPWDKDPQIDMSNRFETVKIDKDHANEGAVGENTTRFNLDREPRFYAWIAFQGSYYEIMSAKNRGAYSNDKSYKANSGSNYGKLICNFLNKGNVGRNSRPKGYAATGYLNKKGVEPGFAVAKNLTSPVEYPWPIYRLADFYLGYAEACVETGDLDEAKTYLNKVRVRAGIPTVEESWENIAGKTLNKDLLRDIVRQERQIELYFENQNFWDMRRWLLAEKYFNVKARGMNINSNEINDFNTETEVPFERKFQSPTQYLLPIPIYDIWKNDKLVQNPGY